MCAFLGHITYSRGISYYTCDIQYIAVAVAVAVNVIIIIIKK